MYCPFGDRIERYLDDLEAAINESRNVLISGDFNAKSELWHSTGTDEKGTLTVDFLQTHDLHTANAPGQPSTFKTLNGESNIDLTIISTPLITKVENWTVHEEASASDHRLITYEIRHKASMMPLDKRPRYNLTNINYERLAETTTALLAELETRLWMPTTRHIDERVEALTTGLQAIQEQVLHKRRRYENRPAWWTDQVERRKLQYYEARNRLKRSANPDDADANLQRLRDARARYKNEILKAKSKSWDTFVAEDLARDPWGTSYKLAANKLKTKKIPSTIRVDHDYTQTIGESHAAILAQMFPEDDVTIDHDEHTDARERAATARGDPELDTIITEADVLKASRGIKTKKAPGVDQIHGAIIKATIGITADYIGRLFNDCLTLGYFPREWKIGNLTTFLKGLDRDPSDPKSLRPITLLPELAKLFERAIREKLFEHFTIQAMHHPRQFGFCAGKGTEDALMALTDHINTQPERLLLVIFVDISGAFDNLWWPSTVNRLNETGTPHKLLSIIRDYLNQREVQVQTETLTIVRRPARGCPQGSVLGPTLWNTAVDQLLEELEQEGIFAVAYADDLAISVKGNNRANLEAQARRATDILERWAARQKLQISVPKTKYVLFKGALRRNPTVKVNNRNIARVTQTKYLGVILDSNLRYDVHIRYIAQKASVIMQQLRSHSRRVLGNARGALRTIYHRAIIPIMSYGINIWGHRISKARNKRKIRAVQGAACKSIAGTYHSTSAEAASVLAGIPPLHLLLEEERVKARLRRSATADHHGTLIRKEDGKATNKATIQENTLARWQDEWDETEKGLTTYRFYPVIAPVLEQLCTHDLTKTVISLLSGHGETNQHLHRIGKRDSPDCATCPNSVDSPMHRILTCRRFDLVRQGLQGLLPTWPPTSEQLGRAILEEPQIAEHMTLFIPPRGDEPV